MNDIPSDIIVHIFTFLEASECLTLSVVTKQDWKINRNRVITLACLELFNFALYSWSISNWVGSHLSVINSLSLRLLGAKKCSYFSNLPQNLELRHHVGMNSSFISSGDPANHEFRDQDFCYYYNPAYVSSERLFPFASPPYPVKKIRYTNKVITITYHLPPNKVTRLRIQMSLTARALVG